MKKIVYSIGLLSSVSIALGWLFIVLHWPGGGSLFNYGFLILTLLFIPLLAIDSYKSNKEKATSQRVQYYFGVLSAVLTGLSVLFNILHLQGADILLILGAMVFCFGFLPFLFFRMYTEAVIKSKSI